MQRDEVRGGNGRRKATAALAPALLGSLVATVLDGAGLVASLPILLLAAALSGFGWAVLCFYLVGRGVSTMGLDAEPGRALVFALLALGTWLLAREPVDAAWRSLWPPHARPGG